MKRINPNSLFPLLALLILVFSLSQQMFSVFPIGKLLDPFLGAVQNESERDLDNPSLVINGMGLAAPVNIYFDNRKVPHIYAANEEDLYFAQGYVTAYLRLWQMDFLSYVSAGRLSEIFKDGFVDYDRNQRRIGMLDAAKAALKMIEADTESNKILTAYSRGVNACMSRLNYKRKPVEYKLLDYDPEPWSKLKTVLIMKYMANLLSGYEEDFSMSNLMIALGEAKFNQFFPDFLPHISPAVKDSSAKPNPSLSYVKRPDYLDYSFLTSGSVISKSSYNPRLGSNSWAVSGKKTKSGFPILCSDPHLSLSLPSIWLEMQLSAPGLNVYGVSIPGTPAVIIGFNDSIAWGITNGADDVKDWYKLKITEDYKKYELDGKWIDLNFRVEEIKRRGQAPLYDTIYYTIHGPIVSDKYFSAWQPERINFSLKWELHQPSNEFLAFIKLNRAKNYHDYKEAISHYACPIQNFTFASKDNIIAVNHQGKMAIKQPGEGKFIQDGTKSSTLGRRYIPEDSLPETLSPSCNYVFSANQHPTGTSYPYYYNGYYPESRANRIQDILKDRSDFDISGMEAMQLDNVNSFAAEALPVIINCVDPGKLTEDQQHALKSLSTWKYTYDFTDEHAKLFELWWKNIKDYTWDEFKAYTFASRVPDDQILLELIRQDPNSIYFDKLGTSAKENAYDIIRKAFVVALADYNKINKGNPVKWGDVNKVNIMHMTNIGAFSRTNISSAGYPETINAISSNWGPSWRMVVELGDRPRAFGVYAGGQSGHVGSPYFDNFINDWNKGNYYPLLFFLNINEAKQESKDLWLLK